MNRRTSARLMVSVLAVLAPAGLLTSCGGSDANDAAANVTTADQAADTVPSDVSVAVPDIGALSPECAKLTEFITALTKAGTGQSFEGLSDAVGALSDSVPADLQDEVATLAGAYGQMESIIADYDGDVATAMADPDVQQQIDALGTDDVVAAGDAVSAYFDQQCPELSDS